MRIIAEIRIKVGSVTNAQRGKRILQNKGYSCKMHRAKNIKSGDGCGYSLITDCNRELAIELLERAAIRIISAE